MTRSTLLPVLVVVWAVAAPVRAQMAPAAGLQPVMAGPFAGSVPAGPATPDVIPLTLAGALERGLAHNLGIITLEQQVESARGTRLRSLRDLLPRVEARSFETRQTTNLAAFGFNGSAFPGFDIPAVVGPFNIFDARVSGSQAILDLRARQDLRSDTLALNAAELDARNAQDIVTLLVTHLYFQSVALASRIQTARAQVATAEALVTLATNQRSAGVATGIDLVRAQVQLQAQRQRLITAQNEHAKQTLEFVRAIGLPVSQGVDLIDRDLVVPLPNLTVDDAVARAAAGRLDYQATVVRVQAAEAALKAVDAEALPSVHVNADVGAIGPTPGNARRTYSLSGSVHLSLFDAGRSGKRVENAAKLRQRQAESTDFAQRVELEVRRAFFDVQASQEQAAVARERVGLARQELLLAETRFRAGVSSNLEVIQAQDEVAVATDSEIAAGYAFNVAKATLVRAIGSGSVNARP